MMNSALEWMKKRSCGDVPEYFLAAAPQNGSEASGG
jgi:hypothetical protein